MLGDVAAATGVMVAGADGSPQEGTSGPRRATWPLAPSRRGPNLSRTEARGGTRAAGAAGGERERWHPCRRRPPPLAAGGGEGSSTPTMGQPGRQTA
jgi:hypothetical protein